MTGISTHVLDTARGGPAPGIPVSLGVRSGDGWRRLGGSVTGATGRAGDLPAVEVTEPTACRLVFAVRDYLLVEHGTAFFPEVTVVFLAAPGEHYHVPLLLAPFGYSLYLGTRA